MSSVSACVEDICRRVFGHACEVRVEQQENAWHVDVLPVTSHDPLTRSQQEMDVILSLQHLLSGAEIRLRVINE